MDRGEGVPREGAERLTVDSPVPVIVELEGQAPQMLPAGHHDVKKEHNHGRLAIC